VRTDATKELFLGDPRNFSKSIKKKRKIVQVLSTQKKNNFLIFSDVTLPLGFVDFRFKGLFIARTHKFYDGKKKLPGKSRHC
jgi:hypothetical protein